MIDFESFHMSIGFRIVELNSFMDYFYFLANFNKYEQPFICHLSGGGYSTNSQLPCSYYIPCGDKYSIQAFLEETFSHLKMMKNLNKVSDSY